jgi:CBS domain-containing protein
VAACVREAGESWAVVVNEERVVLGLLREKHLSGEPSATVQDVMQAGPTTFRPDAEVEAVAERMARRRVDRVLVTNSDGRLVGSLYRADLGEKFSSADDGDGPSCDCS